MEAAQDGRPTMDDARAVLAQHFGYQAFRPGQERVIEAVLQGRDVLAVALKIIRAAWENRNP